MLGRVNSPSNPLNVSERLITEPSEYLENLKKIIVENQKKLNSAATQMQKTVEKLEENILLVKQKLSSLELAKSKLQEQINKNEEMCQTTQDSQKLEMLQNKNKEILAEKQRIESEMSKQLSQINELENSLDSKEKQWNNNKQVLIKKLKQFQEQELVPYLMQIQSVMLLTNSKIEASNTKLTKYMQFGNSDPFVNINEKFEEKFVNREQLFGSNSEVFTHEMEGTEGSESSEGSEVSQETEQNEFGEMEEDIEIKEIDQMDESDTDSESDDLEELEDTDSDSE